MRSLKYLSLLVVLSLTCGACSAQAPPAPPADGKPAAAGSDDANTLYVMGLMLSSNVAPLRLNESELQSLVGGLTDGAMNKPKKVEIEPYMAKVNEWVQARQMATATAEKEAGDKFMEKAVADGAKKTASGMAIKMLSEGTGASPTADDSVTAHYTGTTIDGTVFDSSVQRGQPGTFGLKAVIPCWTEAIPMMKPGGKAKIYCPANLAYGDRGRPPKIQPGATLVFEVELISVQPAGAPAPAPTPPTP